MPPEFSIRSSSVDVEQIMKQIRSRIREKRGVDYTEEEIRELASIKLEKFLDPSRVRSGLLEHYRKGRPSPSATPIAVPPSPPNFAFEADTAYLSSRGAAGRTLYAIRRLLNPLLKLFINPNPIIHVLNMQSTINRESAVRFDRFLEQWQERESRRTELDALGYEVANNLVVEMTRLGIEVKNLKMRVESLSSRLDFNERRARALESVVQYKPGVGPASEPAPAPAARNGGERRREERGRDERRRDDRRDGRKQDGRRQDRPVQDRRPQDARPQETRPQDARDQDARGQEPRSQEPRPPDEASGGGIVKGEAQRSRRRRRRRGRGSAGADASAPQGGGAPDASLADPGQADAGATELTAQHPGPDTGPDVAQPRAADAAATEPPARQPGPDAGPAQLDLPPWPKDPDSPGTDES